MRSIYPNLEFPETLKVTSNIRCKRTDIVFLTKFILNVILGFKDINLTIAYNDNILRKYSTSDVELFALLDKSPLPHTYVLYIRSDVGNVEDIICHELCHLNQYELNKLKVIKEDKLRFWWMGKEYPTSMDYWSRPWEKEARKNTYWKQFKNFGLKIKR